MHIHALPFREKRDLCKILESSNCYYDLAITHMQFDELFVQTLSQDCRKTGTSVIEKLLDEWDTYGHTILELFILLNRLKQYEAMTILKPFIEPKYHFLIKENFESEKILNGPVESRDDNITIEKPKINESAGSIPLISYEELQKSTNNWDDNNILGRGGFGKVFKGYWKYTQVAIKRIEKKDDSPDSTYQQIVQSNTELQCLNSYRHDNILPLYGYSTDGPQPCLVYQFMSGGSLESRLHINDFSKILSWPSRLNISIGTARGLQFLHTIREKPLIHGDIKSANILLDSNDNPRIGDFGLAREGPASDYIKVTRIHGTRPYLPDEFMKFRKFSTKVDTYSFGVVLFELATGQSAYSNRRPDKFLRDFVVNCDDVKLVDLKDSRVNDNSDKVFWKLIKTGKECVDSSAKNRPEMVEVLQKLEL